MAQTASVALCSGRIQYTMDEHGLVVGRRLDVRLDGHDVTSH